MRPGLRMAMMTRKDENHRKIGFGEHDREQQRREPVRSRPMRDEGGYGDDMRYNYDDDDRRMMGDDPYGDPAEMRRRRDKRGRYMGYDEELEMNYPTDNIVPMPRQWPQRAGMDSAEKGHEQQKVQAGGTFWMIPPEGTQKLSREKAEQWVKKINRRGGGWTWEDAKRLGEECGVGEGQDMINFFAALNMMASDYRDVARKYGVDNEKYYAALALAFLHDKDGKRPSEKLAAYYKYVVPHDED